MSAREALYQLHRTSNPVSCFLVLYQGLPIIANSCHLFYSTKERFLLEGGRGTKSDVRAENSLESLVKPAGELRVVRGKD